MLRQVKSSSISRIKFSPDVESYIPPSKNNFQHPLTCMQGIIEVKILRPHSQNSFVKAPKLSHLSSYSLQSVNPNNLVKVLVNIFDGLSFITVFCINASSANDKTQPSQWQCQFFFVIISHLFFIFLLFFIYFCYKTNSWTIDQHSHSLRNGPSQKYWQYVAHNHMTSYTRYSYT